MTHILIAFNLIVNGVAYDARMDGAECFCESYDPKKDCYVERPMFDEGVWRVIVLQDAERDLVKDKVRVVCVRSTEGDK